MTDRPDIDTLAETVRETIGWPDHPIRREAHDALSDLAARARDGFDQGWTSGRADIEAADARAEAAEAERDRLCQQVRDLTYNRDRYRERVTELEAALRKIASSETVLTTPGVLDRSFSGQTAQEYKRLARVALAGDGGGA